MLATDDINQIVEIVEKGIEGMEEDGYRDYFLQFVRWDDEDGHWVVGFYTEESNLDTVAVIVKCDRRGCVATGRLYE